MKELKKVALHILSWMTVPLLIIYFKWAAQETTYLPGLPVTATDSFFEIVKNNTDVIIVSLLGSIPIFYMSLFYLTPKFLFKTNIFKIILYGLGLITYFFIVSFISGLIFPMYYFFGTPYAIKVLAPIVLLSALSGTLFAYNEKL